MKSVIKIKKKDIQQKQKVSDAEILADIDNRSQAQIEKLGLLPSFHPRCRCAIVAIGIKR